MGESFIVWTTKNLALLKGGFNLAWLGGTFVAYACCDPSNALFKSYFTIDAVNQGNWSVSIKWRVEAFVIVDKNY